VEKRAFDQLSNFGPSKPTCAVASVQILPNPATQLDGKLGFGLGPEFKFIPSSDEDFGGQRIRQPEVERLDRARMIPVRKVTTRVPAEMRVG